MPRLSSSSYLSSEDKNGHCHTVSIDFCKFHNSEHCSIYKCLARSNSGYYDPKDRAIILAKFCENNKDEAWSEGEIDRSKIAQDVAVKFNNFCRHMRKSTKGPISSEPGNREVEFEIPQTCKLASVSTLDRKRRKNETFLLMSLFLTFQRFIFSEQLAIDSSLKKQKPLKGTERKSKFAFFRSVDNIFAGQKSIPSRSRRSSESEAHRRLSMNYCSESNQWNTSTGQKTGSNIPHEHLRAFVHFFFCQSNGEMAIDCLEGEYDENDGYTLTVPVIHSRERRFGRHDRGMKGICSVIDNHVCTHLCSHLKEMKIVPTHDTAPQHDFTGRTSSPPLSYPEHQRHMLPVTDNNVVYQNSLYPKLPQEHGYPINGFNPAPQFATQFDNGQYPYPLPTNSEHQRPMFPVTDNNSNMVSQNTHYPKSHQELVYQMNGFNNYCAPQSAIRIGYDPHTHYANQYYPQPSYYAYPQPQQRQIS